MHAQAQYMDAQKALLDQQLPAAIIQRNFDLTTAGQIAIKAARATRAVGGSSAGVNAARRLIFR